MEEPKQRHGDFDYEGHASEYLLIRRPDARIAARLEAALGNARTVLNVGAGTGSYEPKNRTVFALEPAAEMRARRTSDAVPALRGTSDELPFDDNAVDACMSILSVHHWTHLERGLREMRRVARGPVVILSFDREALRGWWLNDYCSEVFDVESKRYPALDHLAEVLGGKVVVETVPIAIDCTDGFSEAYYARPEAFLDDRVLASQSAWGFVEPRVIERFQDQLRRDLESGSWDARYGDWRRRNEYEGAVRILTAR